MFDGSFEVVEKGVICFCLTSRGSKVKKRAERNKRVGKVENSLWWGLFWRA